MKLVDCKRVEVQRIYKKKKGILAINGMAHFLSQPSDKIFPVDHKCQIDLYDIGIKSMFHYQSFSMTYYSLQGKSSQLVQ